MTILILFILIFNFRPLNYRQPERVTTLSENWGRKSETKAEPIAVADDIQRAPPVAEKQISQADEEKQRQQEATKYEIWK